MIGTLGVVFGLHIGLSVAVLCFGRSVRIRIDYLLRSFFRTVVGLDRSLFRLVDGDSAAFFCFVESLIEIAGEKAAIIKRNVPAVCAEQSDGTMTNARAREDRDVARRLFIP